MKHLKLTLWVLPTAVLAACGLHPHHGDAVEICNTVEACLGEDYIEEEYGTHQGCVQDYLSRDTSEELWAEDLEYWRRQSC